MFENSKYYSMCDFFYENPISRFARSIGLIIILCVWMITLMSTSATASPYLKPDNVTSTFSDNSSYSRLLTQGIDYYQKGLYEKARLIFTNLSTISPDDPIVQYYLGLTSYMLGDLTSAERAFDVAVHQNVSPDALFYYGATLYGLKNFSGSFDAYEQYVRIFPNDSYALFNLGQAYEQAGQYNSALIAYQKATEIDPRYAKPWFFIGGLYESFGDYQKAADSYRYYTILAPDDDRGWFARSRMEYKLLQKNESIMSLKKAIQFSPENSLYQEYLQLYADNLSLIKGAAKSPVSIEFICMALSVLAIMRRLHLNK